MLDIDPLTDLTIKLSRQSLSDKDKHLAICQTIAASVNTANRVSLWCFNAERTEISCLILLDHGTPLEFDEIILREADYPEYFSAVVNNEIVVASDARSHDATRCFNKDYFPANDIYSLLDFVFHQQFQPIGVICCEAVGTPIEWSEKDIALIKRTARITSMFY